MTCSSLRALLEALDAAAATHRKCTVSPALLSFKQLAARHGCLQAQFVVVAANTTGGFQATSDPSATVTVGEGREKERKHRLGAMAAAKAHLCACREHMSSLGSCIPAAACTLPLPRPSCLQACRRPRPSPLSQLLLSHVQALPGLKPPQLCATRSGCRRRAPLISRT